MSITTCLWFNQTMAEAVKVYTDLFPDSDPGDCLSGPMTAEWTMFGQTFRGINVAEERWSFNESISLSVACKTQEEADHYWDVLSDGGEESQCGWVKDRFGLWWQIVPDGLGELMGDPNPARAQAAQQALFGMQRIVLADIRAAADAASHAG